MIEKGGGWWSRRAQRRRCFHHDWRTGRTFMSSQLIDTGMRKMFWCDRIKGGCEKVWIP